MESTPPAAAGGVLFLCLNSVLDLSDRINFVLPLSLLSTGIILAILGLARNRQRLASLLFLFISGFCAAFGSAAAADFLDDLASPGLQLDTIKSVTLQLTSDTRLLGKGRWAVDGRLKSTSSEQSSAGASGRVLIFGSGDTDSLASGRIVSFNGRLRMSGTQGYDAPFVLSADDFITLGWTSRWKAQRYRVFRILETRLASAEPDAASFSTALLLGRNTDRGSPIMTRFREAGCLHLLALSGFHVGLIALAIRFLLKPLVGFTASTIISAIGAVLFLMLTGMRPSLLRAVLMYLLWSRDTLKGRKVSPIAYLSCAFLLQATLMPLSTHSLSFKLSYMAIGGLLTVGKAYTGILRRILPGGAAAALGAGLGAQFVTLPLVVSTFGLWRPIGIAAAPLLTLMTTAAMALGSLSILYKDLTMGLNFLVNLIELASSPFSRFGAAQIGIVPAWLITAAGTILPLTLYRSIRREQPPYSEPRLPGLYPCLSGQQRAGSEKTVGAELPNQPWSQGKNHLTTRRQTGSQRLGNRSGTGRHEFEHPGHRGSADGV